MNKYSKLISILLFIASLGALGLGIKLKEQQQDLLRHQNRLMTTLGEVAETLGIADHLPSLSSSGLEMDAFTKQVKASLAKVAQSKHHTKKVATDLGQVSAAQKVQSSQLRMTAEKLKKATADLLEKEKTLAEISKKQNEAERALNQQQRDATELKAKLKGARSALLEADEKRLAAKDRTSTRIPPRSKLNTPAVVAHVASLNTEWNFLVVDAGSHKNVKVKQEALIHRGKAFIARIQITRVAARHSVAEVTDGTRLDSIQPGDTILFD